MALWSRSPSSIRFSQSDIKSEFTHGVNAHAHVHTVVDDIRNGSRHLNDIIPINVAKCNGQWYTENNRSLYVCRVLEYNGVISCVTVKEINANKLWHRMTTENDGVSISIRGEHARPHSVEDINERNYDWSTKRDSTIVSTRDNEVSHSISDDDGEKSSSHVLAGTLGAGAAVLGAAALFSYAMGGEEKPPSSIRFSQSSIASYFSDTHDDLHDVIDDIRNGYSSVERLLPIDIARYNGQWYTVNNRRLYVCRVLQYYGKISKIRVNEVKENRVWRLMSTRNEGVSVTMRSGEATRPHSIQDIESRNHVNPEAGDAFGIGAIALGAAALFSYAFGK